MVTTVTRPLSPCVTLCQSLLERLRIVSRAGGRVPVQPGGSSLPPSLLRPPLSPPWPLFILAAPSAVPAEHTRFPVAASVATACSCVTAWPVWSLRPLAGDGEPGTAGPRTWPRVRAPGGVDGACSASPVTLNTQVTAPLCPYAVWQGPHHRFGATAAWVPEARGALGPSDQGGGDAPGTEAPSTGCRQSPSGSRAPGCFPSNRLPGL